MDKVDIIISQTNYTREIAIEMLLKHNDDHIKVIKEYLGITEKPIKMTSVNQEIYKLLRKQIDISHYNSKINLQMET
jgi:hypothetical protein